MHLSNAILGKHAVDHLQQTARAAVIEIGSDKLTRADLARVGCYNFMAARMLSAVLHRELQVKNLREVYETIPPSALTLPRLGAVSLAVLGAAFEARKLGDLESYVKRHLAAEQQVTTWHTMKAHEAAEVARERKEKRARKEKRRGKAHELRVARFEQRQPQMAVAG